MCDRAPNLGVRRTRRAASFIFTGVVPGAPLTPRVWARLAGSCPVRDRFLACSTGEGLVTLLLKVKT